MKITYGLPYKGSKNRLAKEIASLFPKGGTLYDLFCGGGAITHYAMMNGLFNHYVMNDLDPMPVKLFKNAMEGQYLNRKEWVSRDDFIQKKLDDEFIRFAYSFGNKGGEYIYSDDFEKLKQLAHTIVTSDSIFEREMSYKHFVRQVSKWILEKQRPYLSKFQHFENIKRINSLVNIPQKENLTFSFLSYEEVALDDPKGVIYCDIPYKGTSCYKPQEQSLFDYEKFYSWACSQTLPIFISELWLPPDLFVPIWEKQIPHKVCKSNNNYPVVERVFIPKKQKYELFN